MPDFVRCSAPRPELAPHRAGVCIRFRPHAVLRRGHHSRCGHSDAGDSDLRFTRQTRRRLRRGLDAGAEEYSPAKEPDDWEQRV